MKWVTRDHVHMDRVATPWAILRFIDPEAEFVFVPIAKTFGPTLDPTIVLPDGAIPFGLPGFELGPHDQTGCTFRKLLTKYGVNNPVLERMARIIESGVTHEAHRKDADYSVANLDHPEGVGLAALALGLLYGEALDAENIKRSMVIYDALYDYCAGAIIETQEPAIAALPLPARWDVLRERFDRERPWGDGTSVHGPAGTLAPEHVTSS